MARKKNINSSKPITAANPKVLDHFSPIIPKTLDKISPSFPGIQSIVIPGRSVEDTSINSDVENALFGEDLAARSFVSRPIFSYDVPEVSNLEAKFVYNYFTRDERVRPVLSPEEQMVNIDAANTSDIFYQVKNDKLPRYVKFSFTPAEDPYAVPANRITTIVRDNLDKLIIEGAGSTQFHTGVELLDSNLEKSLYTYLTGSFTYIKSVTEKDSPKASAEKLENELKETGGLTGKSKKFILEAMSTMQSSGVSFAPSDVPPEIAQTSDDPLTKQTFSLKFNNLFIGDMVKAATRIPDKVFQDEIEALRDPTDKIQSELIGTIDPEVVSDAEFDNAIEAISIRPFDNVKDKDVQESNHIVTQLGYIIQRTEILADETAVNLEPLYSDNPSNGLYVIDKAVRYGGVYVYKVRTVCKVKSILRDFDKTDPMFDEVCVAEFLLASEGITTSVACSETIPPPPPVRVGARLEPYLKKPVITWQFPLNKQRDIKRFQIFKRQNVSQPFTLVCEYDFDDSMIRTSTVEKAPVERIFRMTSPKLDYLDEEYEKGEASIYAISCVDAHGYSSDLSAQLQVRYDRFKNKLITKVISGEGAPKPYPNLLLEDDAFSDAMKVSGYDRMTVFFDPEYYRVFKYQKTEQKRQTKQGTIKLIGMLETDQNFLMVNPDKATYQIQILNVDIQKDEVVNIKIADKSGPPNTIRVAEISKSNLNFEFGVE